MRPIAIYAFVVSMIAVVLALDSLRMHHQSAGAAGIAVGVTATPTKAGPARARTFTATNGVVLTSDDLDRIDADGREVDKHIAELEYIAKQSPLPWERPGRAKSKP